ncbi:MAG: glucosaminidase domain-containing protein, partial [Rikenellaceae bacterium]
MMKKLLPIFFLLCVTAVYAQKIDPQQAYIDKYKTLAIEEMEKYGIPASITMAQGILE